MAISDSQRQKASTIKGELDSMSAIMDEMEDTPEWWERYGIAFQEVANAVTELAPPKRHHERTSRAMMARAPK